MPVCPVCKSEYREGIVECYDCKVPLVDNLISGPMCITRGSKEDLEKIKNACATEGLDSGFLKQDEEQGGYMLFFACEEIKRATIVMKEVRGQLEAEEENEDATVDASTTDDSPTDGAKEPSEISTKIVDKEAKVADYKSSGYVLLIVGAMGMACILVLYFGLIPALDVLANNYMFMGVMSLLFVVFLFAGGYTLFKVKDIRYQAEKEEALCDDILAYMEEYLSKTVIDAKVPIGDDPMEEAYFKRYGYMDYMVRSQYPMAKDDMVEQLIEEHYNKLYENHHH